jgi:hypothetical protein
VALGARGYLFGCYNQHLVTIGIVHACVTSSSLSCCISSATVTLENL